MSKIAHYYFYAFLIASFSLIILNLKFVIRAPLQFLSYQYYFLFVTEVKQIIVVR